VQRGRPLAIGLDIIFTEPDGSSPEQVAARLRAPPALGAALRALPAQDDILAQSFGQAPVVVGAALHDDPERGRIDARLRHGPLAALRIVGEDPSPFLRQWRSAMRTLPNLEAAAAGVATLTAEREDGVVRRVPLLQRAGEAVWPTLSMEMLRVAAGADALTVHADKAGVHAIEVAEFAALTDPDAQMWVDFAPVEQARIVSASAVLDGTVDPTMLENKLVLVGFYAFGLLDVVSTPLRDRRAGVEAHAEVIENVLDRRLLQRPRFAAWLELGTVAAGGLLLLWWMPRLRGSVATLLLAALLAACAAGGLLAFAQLGWLLDVAGPSLALALLFAAMLSLTLSETERRRRALALELQLQREAQARMEGELAAAQRIQLGLLPKPEVALAGESRVDVAAFILPARSVGGDLYDFFMLDEHRLFVTIGDVSGKGVPASLFMALAKSLTKSSALRDEAAIAEVVSRAQTEIARDNPEFMFMTLAAFVLDLRDGSGHYVNAGHETPLLMHGNDIQPLEAGGGPPICVLDDFEFSAAPLQLQRGDRLLLMTDGVTEAQDPQGALYGRDRFEAMVQRAFRDGGGHAPSARAIVDALYEDVLAFAAGTELPDDIALVTLTWLGDGGARAG
jgi:serine phosphatase RsbU (regulator of sigma subunit)/CHASE2 domain-containing sensor protein